MARSEGRRAPSRAGGRSRGAFQACGAPGVRSDRVFQAGSSPSKRCVALPRAIIPTSCPSIECSPERLLESHRDEAAVAPPRRVVPPPDSALPGGGEDRRGDTLLQRSAPSVLAKPGALLPRPPSRGEGGGRILGRSEE